MPQSLSDILGSLTPVKPGDDVADVASAKRMNAIQDAIRALTRGDNINSGPNIRKFTQDGFVLLSGQPGGGQGGSGIIKTPFFVSAGADSSFPPYPILKLYPGKFSTVTATIDGIPLDTSPTAPIQPWLYTPSTDFSVWLRVWIDLTMSENQYRSYILLVEVIHSQDSQFIEDLDDDTAMTEGRIFWDEDEDFPDLNVKGHIYFLVADVKAELGTNGVVFKQITQWLFTNYKTFVVAGNDFLPMI